MATNGESIEGGVLYQLQKWKPGSSNHFKSNTRNWWWTSFENTSQKSHTSN